jgi:glycosyltransferase involved in cell wall biosynthesis
MQPEVSVIIPTYNRRAMVREAIASVMDQRVAAAEVACEVIVVDDGSTDRTAEELDRTRTARNGNRMRMHVVRTENRGVASARNTGVAIAAAPLIAFLDSDDLWLPHKLERQLEFMRAHPEFAIAQTDEVWMRGGRRVNPGLRHRKRSGDIFIDSLRTCLISPSAVMLRTAVFRRLGGFDGRMAAAEDYDLWLRILVGHNVGLLAEPLVMRRAGYSMPADDAADCGQLSARVPAIDRFRILALLKLVADDDLDNLRRHAVNEVIAEKCTIYAQGLRRRGREADAIAVAEIGSQANAAAGDTRKASQDDSIAKLISIVAADTSCTATPHNSDELQKTSPLAGQGSKAAAEIVA